MVRSNAPRRDFAAMQERRRSAARLFAAGKRSQAEIARELDISRQSVSRWFKAWRQDNPNWIRGAGRAGRRPQLDKAQLKQVDKALRQGAQAHGLATAQWTLPRVARSSNGSRAFTIILATYGRFLRPWSGACNDRPSGRDNAMKKGGGCFYHVSKPSLTHHCQLP
jgi:transposase